MSDNQSVTTPPENGTTKMAQQTNTSHGVKFADAFRTWLKIALLSFGGPAGQIAMMHRILVDEKKWISESRFLHALNYCMLLPGPEAQQLTVYLGWLLHRTWGGIVAGVLFVLPGAVTVLLLSILYAGYQDLSIVEAIFFGIKAAVLAVVIEAVLKIGSKVLKNGIMVAIAVIAFIGIYAFQLPFPLIVIGAGLIGFIGGKIYPAKFEIIKGKDIKEDGPKLDQMLDNGELDHVVPSTGRAAKVLLICLTLWFGPIIAMAMLFGPASVFVQEGLFFSKMAVVTFGGAYAVLAYMAQQAVNTYGWLNPGEMLDGLGMAETTPGPLIMVVQFVGFMGAYRNPGMFDPMIAGVIGAMLTTWVIFVPCFLWIFLGAPYIEKMRGNRSLSTALSGITAAIVGVILNLAIWFSMHVVFADISQIKTMGMTIQIPVWNSIDPAAFAIAAGALVAMQYFKIGMIKTLAISALIGTLIFYARM